MRKRKRKLLKSILISLVIVAALIAAVFFTYRYFSDKEKTLGEDTFIFAILEKDEDNVEHINNIFLINISDKEDKGKKDKEIQIISIPPDLKCEVPGVSIDKIGDLYPFGGGSLIAASISEKLDLSIGYYMIFPENYFKNLLDDIAPVTVSLAEDMSIDELDFVQGEAALNSGEISFLLNYDYSNDYYREAQESKLYIMREIFSDLKDKKINLFNKQASNGIDTNIDDSYINLVNSYFLNASTIFYYDCLDENYLKEAGKKLKEVVLEDNYSDIELPGIKKYYEKPAESEEEELVVEEEESIETAEEEITEELVTRENLQIQVLNGNYIPGSATATSLKLEELGYTNFDTGNVEDGSVYDNSLIYFKEGLDDFADEIGERLGIDESLIQNFEDEATGDFDILIIVGLDYREE